MNDGTVSIASQDLSASISTLGAELQTLRDRRGRDLLWDGDLQFWTGRAPILFPIIGELRGGRYRIGERTYVLPRHGFARRRRFTIAERSGTRAVLRLEADAETRMVYPFAFRLDLIFAIDGARLTVTAELTNPGEEALPSGLGFHPAFRWPLPYGEPRAAHQIVFEEAEPAPIRRLGADGLLDPAPVPTPVQDRLLRLDDSLFVNDAIVMVDPASRRLTYGAPDGPKLTVAYPDFPQLGLWSKPGAGFICIEPWQSYADLAGFEGEIWDKPGIARLEAGEKRRWTTVVELVAQRQSA